MSSWQTQTHTDPNWWADFIDRHGSHLGPADRGFIAHMLRALSAELETAKQERDRLAQEAEHPFDASEFKALHERVVAVEKERDTLRSVIQAHHAAGVLDNVGPGETCPVCAALAGDEPANQAYRCADPEGDWIKDQQESSGRG